MTRAARHSSKPSRRPKWQGPPQARYAATVCGDGRVMPITETCGRRLIREIDPLSSQGRSLLAAGQVTLRYDDGRCVTTAPIDDVLASMESAARARRDAYPHLPEWRSHHDLLVKSISRMKRRLEPQH